jgi:glutamine synthetase
MGDYKRLRVLFPDHLGLARGKYIPASQETNHVSHCIGTFSLNFDRTMTPAPGSRMLEGLPDCRAVFAREEVRPGWEAATGVVVADLEFQGKPLSIAPRHVLRRAVADWEALGYRPRVGIELEAYVMQRDDRGGWTAWDTPGAFVYGTGPTVDPVGLFDEIMDTADRCGLPIESINSEYDAPQFELTLVCDDALKAVDDIFLFKVMAREVAAKHDLLLTFLGKPFAGRSGSGLHVNFSMLDQHGENRFADAKADDGLSCLARQCIGGLIAHHSGMAALCVPTVNGYKRLRPGQLAGYWANWGYDHRGATLRVPEARADCTRLEHRMSDGAANPYLATAAVLQAARLGVVNKLSPPPPEEQDCLEHQSTDQHVPDDLGSALDALEADQPLVDAVGRDMTALFLSIKRAEWQKFTAAVTDWELNYYLPFL